MFHGFLVNNKSFPYQLLDKEDTSCVHLKKDAVTCLECQTAKVFLHYKRAQKM